MADHDRYPDLASYGHAGDGVHSATARLGGETGPDRDHTEKNRQYSKDADRTGRRTPTDMPRVAPTTFRPPCETDATG